MDDEYKAWRDQVTRRAETMEAASIESANQVLKALFLLNGGACVAVLGFLASTFNADADTDRARLIADMLASLRWFSMGAGCAVLASGLAYLTNSAYARGLIDVNDRKAWWWGMALNKVAVMVSIASFVLFCVGLLSIRQFYA